MKIKRSNNKTRRYIIFIVFVLFIVLAAFIYVYEFNGSILGWNNNKDNTTSRTNLDRPTKAQKEAGDQAKKNTVEGTKPGSKNSDSPEVPTPQPNGAKSNVDVNFTAASQNDDILQLRVLISTVENSGSCTLTLTKGSQSILKTSDTQAQANTSTCKGFDVPISELGPGSWQATIKYSGSLTTGTATKTVEIR